MSDPNPPEAEVELDKKKSETPRTSTSETDRVASAANQLSIEEQMALYENDLKENDWGHQPC